MPETSGQCRVTHPRQRPEVHVVRPLADRKALPLMTEAPLPDERLLLPNPALNGLAWTNVVA